MPLELLQSHFPKNETVAMRWAPSHPLPLYRLETRTPSTAANPPVLSGHRRRSTHAREVSASFTRVPGTQPTSIDARVDYACSTSTRSGRNTPRVLMGEGSLAAWPRSSGPGFAICSRPEVHPITGEAQESEMRIDQTNPRFSLQPLPSPLIPHARNEPTCQSRSPLPDFLSFSLQPSAFGLQPVQYPRFPTRRPAP
jgi:hypothetical protein